MSLESASIAGVLSCDTDMNHEDIIKSLKKKSFSPVYLLHGEESYFIDQISDYIENKVLSESEKSFNLTVLYGKDCNPQTIIDCCRRYPVMSEKQVVIIKEAQQMRDLDKLEHYLTHPLSSTILVLCHKHDKVDGRKKWVKAAKTAGVEFESKSLYDNAIGDWIIQYLGERDTAIQPEAAVLMADCLGTELSKVANELDKLLINNPKGNTITVQQVKDNIGISKEFNVFELMAAMARKDIYRSNLIANNLSANAKENPLVKTLYSMSSFFANLYLAQNYRGLNDRDLIVKIFLPKAKPEEIDRLYRKYTFAIKDYKNGLQHYTRAQSEKAIALLCEYDLKSKGLDSDNVDDSSLLRELVWKIMH